MPKPRRQKLPNLNPAKKAAKAGPIPAALSTKIELMQQMMQDPNHVHTPEMQLEMDQAMKQYAQLTGMTSEDAHTIHFGKGPISSGSEDLGTDSVRIPEDDEPLPAPSPLVELQRIEKKQQLEEAGKKASLLNPTNTGSLAPKPQPLGPLPKSQNPPLPTTTAKLFPPNPQTPINQNPPMNMMALSAAAQAKQASPAAASPMDMSALSPYSNPPMKVMDMGKLGPYSQQPAMSAPPEGQVNMQKLLTTLGMGAGGGLALEHIMKALYQKPEAQEQMYLSGPGPMVK